MSATSSGDDRSTDEQARVDDAEPDLARVEPTTTTDHEAISGEVADDEPGADEPWLLDQETWPAEQDDGPQHEPRRRALPWSDRSILVVSVICVLVIAPLWLDPVTLGEVVGMAPGVATSGPGLDLASPGDGAHETPPPDPGQATIVGSDTFGRIVTAGWGAADIGGTYSTVGSGLRVDGRAGVVTVASGRAGSAQLPDVAATHTSIAFSLALDRIPEGGEIVTYGLLRASGTDVAYLFGLHLSADGALYCGVERVIDGTARPLGQLVAVGSAPDASAPQVHVRAQALGVDPTTLRMRVWRQGTAEPQGWDVSLIDWTGQLQRPGAAGVAWLHDATLGDDVTLRFTDLNVESEGDPR